MDTPSLTRTPDLMNIDERRRCNESQLCKCVSMVVDLCTHFELRARACFYWVGRYLRTYSNLFRVAAP